MGICHVFFPRSKYLCLAVQFPIPDHLDLMFCKAHEVISRQNYILGFGGALSSSGK